MRLDERDEDEKVMGLSILMELMDLEEWRWEE